MWLLLSFARASTALPLFASLTDSAGAPIQGAHLTEVRLWADALGTTALGPASASTVTFVDGAFYLEHPIDPATLHGRAQAWLQVRVDGGAWSAFTPVHPTPFAVEALHAATATAADHAADADQAGAATAATTAETGTNALALDGVPAADWERTNSVIGWSRLTSLPAHLAPFTGSASVTVGGDRSISANTTWMASAARSATPDTEAELRAELDDVYVSRASLPVAGGQLTLANAGGSAACAPANAGQIRWTGTNFEGCNGSNWVNFGIQIGDSASAAGATCKAIKTIRPTAGSGLYWIDPDGTGPNAAVQTWCDMVTDGGGWTLAAHGHVGGALATNKNLPSLKCGGGSFAPAGRGNLAGAINAVALARASTEVAFAMSSGGATVSTGNLSAYTEAHKFTIPDPAAITFDNHSYMRSTTAGGACTQVTVTQIVGGTNTGIRYTLRNSLGATWSDSYPTGYGAVSSNTCRNFTLGPFIGSIHSGDGHSTDNGPPYSTCDVPNADDQYNHQNIWTQTAVNLTGATSVWFR